MASPQRGALFKISSGRVAMDAAGIDSMMANEVSTYMKRVSNSAKDVAIQNLSNTMVGVITGDLRRSVRVEQRKLSGSARRWTLSADTPYAVHVHNGFTHNRSGKFIQGRPYLMDAINRTIRTTF